MNKLLSFLTVFILFLSPFILFSCESGTGKDNINQDSVATISDSMERNNNGNDKADGDGSANKTGDLTDGSNPEDGDQNGGGGDLKLGSPAADYTKDELLGRFNPAKKEGFVKIESAYTSKTGIYMRKQAYESFKMMYSAAKKEGIEMVIVSATRNFDYQKGIWERKFTGKTLVGGKNLAEKYRFPLDRATEILKYSSMPGSSRHHWGTDIDLNNLNNDWFESGKGKKLYDWMVAHAAEYGFCQPYSPKGESRPNGYEEEKWHWSYMPLSGPMKEAYQNKVMPTDISNFQGSEVVADLKIIEYFVLGINPLCQ